MNSNNTLADMWDEASLEAFGSLPKPQGPAEETTDMVMVCVAHRAFHCGALAMLECLKRGGDRDALIDEAMAVLETPLGELR